MTFAILVVEDEEGLREYLEKFLLDNGYSVEAAATGTDALAKIEKSIPDLVLLDLGLPDLSGETVCREIRKKSPDLPILILTARSEISDIVRGLNLGADDYVTKPFEEEVLLARIRARLRSGANGQTKLKIADLEVDTAAFEVKRQGKPIALTPKEFKLLEYLMINKGRILSRNMILNRIWFYPSDVDTRAVDVYIGYLRKKIDFGFDQKLIHSIRGYGYLIKD